MLSVNHGQTLQCKEPGAAKPQPNKKSNITTKEGTKSTKFMTKNIRTLRVSRRLIRPLASLFVISFVVRMSFVKCCIHDA